jgi:hypothetical protein
MFWGEGRYGVQPPLTDAVVQDAERQLGIRLPASLLEMLRVQNGSLVAELWNAFIATASRPCSTLRIWSRSGTFRLLWFLLSGDGHCWIALGYRGCGKHGEPSVTRFDVDGGTELPLAADFQAFIEGLVAATVATARGDGGGQPA